MAKIVIRCRYTGNYISTCIDADAPQAAEGGRIFCPYCGTEHVWSRAETAADDGTPPRRNPLVRQAG